MKIVLFCWKCHRLLVFFFCFFFAAALMCQSGPALADSHSVNQRNSVLCHTLPQSFTARDGGRIPSFGLINSCFLVTSQRTAGSHLLLGNTDA